MHTPDLHDIHELLCSHRSIRKFTDETVSDDTVADIVRAGLWAATSSNLAGDHRDPGAEHRHPQRC
jgi:nitroreductase